MDIDPVESADVIREVDIHRDKTYPLDIAVQGGYAYVTRTRLASVNYPTIQIIDINPPETAAIVASADTWGHNVYGIEINGRYAYVADRDIGLRVYQLW